MQDAVAMQEKANRVNQTLDDMKDALERAGKSADELKLMDLKKAGASDAQLAQAKAIMNAIAAKEKAADVLNKADNPYSIDAQAAKYAAIAAEAQAAAEIRAAQRTSSVQYGEIKTTPLPAGTDEALFMQNLQAVRELSQATQAQTAAIQTQQPIAQTPVPQSVSVQVSGGLDVNLTGGNEGIAQSVAGSRAFADKFVAMFKEQLAAAFRNAAMAKS